ncbi:hypothetical protein Ae201684P_008298 [Aphanomyces euteiches]|nr:hypothetical protein Ae201684P_008298 [Aphanomyces euteiches]
MEGPLHRPPQRAFNNPLLRYDALIGALRSCVQGDEGLRGALDFLNWPRERFLVVGDLVGWVDTWQSDGSFDFAINILGTCPPNTATAELIFPADPLIDEVEENVRYWRSRIELSPLELASGVVSGEETKESRDGETNAASDS